MPELTPEQKAQLDKNIRSMLSQGASQDDVTNYANDFKLKYDTELKKKGSVSGGVENTTASNGLSGGRLGGSARANSQSVKDNEFYYFEDRGEPNRGSISDENLWRKLPEGKDIFEVGAKTKKRYTALTDAYRVRTLTKEEQNELDSFGVGDGGGGRLGKLATDDPLNEKKRLADYITSLKTPEQKEYSKQPAPIVSTTNFKKNETPFDQTREEAFAGASKKLGDIMYGDGDGWKDPIKTSLNGIKSSQSTQDALNYYGAKNLTEESLMPDGFEANRILSSTHFGNSGDDNLTAKALRNKVVDYEKSVAPFRGINPNELTYLTKDRLYDAAIRSYANKNEHFKKQLEAAGIDINANDIRLRMGDSDAKMGQVMSAVLDNPDLRTFIQKENPDLLPAIQDIQENLIYDNKDYGKVQLANEISRDMQKSGYNKIDPIFNFEGNAKDAGNATAEVLYANDPKKLQFYRDNKDDILSKLDAPSLMTGFAEAGRGFGKGLINTFTQPFESLPKTIKEGWEKEASHVSADPKGLVKFLSDSGHALGFVASIGATGNVLGGIGFSPNAASMTSLGVGFLGDNLEQAKMKYPDSPVKQWTSALFNTGLFMAMGKSIFPAAKVEQAFARVQPGVSKVIENLTAGKITREAARVELNNFGKQALEIAGSGLQKNIKVSAEMTGITILNKAMDRILGMDKQAFAEFHPEGEESDTFKSMFLSNIIVNGLAARGQVRAKNNMAKESIYEAASNPNRYRNIIESSEISKNVQNTKEILDNLDYVTNLKKELDTRDLSEKQKKDYLFNALQSKVLNASKPASPDATLTRRHQERIKNIEEINEGILSGKDADEVVTTTEQKAIDELQKVKDEGDKATLEIEKLTKNQELDDKEIDAKIKGLDKDSTTYSVQKEKLEQQRKEKKEEYESKVEKLTKPSLIAQAIEAVDKDLPEYLREGAKANIETLLREVAEQLNSTPSEAKTARSMYKDAISDIALKLFPDAKTEVPEGYEQRLADASKPIDQKREMADENTPDEVVSESVAGSGGGVDNKTKQQLLDEREKLIRDIKKKAEGTKEERDKRYKQLVDEFGEEEGLVKFSKEISDRAKIEIDKLPALPKTENEIINEKGESDFEKIKKDLGFKPNDYKWGEGTVMDEDMGDMLLSKDKESVIFIKPNEVEVYDEKNDQTDTITNGVKIELVSTKENSRGKGKAKEMIQKVTDWADKNNTDLHLDIAPQDKSTTESGLKKLYESFGFEFDGIHGVRKPKAVEESLKETPKAQTPSQEGSAGVVEGKASDVDIMTDNGEDGFSGAMKTPKGLVSVDVIANPPNSKLDFLTKLTKDGKSIGEVWSSKESDGQWRSTVNITDESMRGMNVYGKVLDAIEKKYNIEFVPGELSSKEAFRFWEKRGYEKINNKWVKKETTKAQTPSPKEGEQAQSSKVGRGVAGSGGVGGDKITFKKPESNGEWGKVDKDNQDKLGEILNAKLDRNDIIIDGKNIGTVTVGRREGEGNFVQNIRLENENIGKGIGNKVYLKLNEQSLEETGLPLQSSVFKDMGANSIKFWDKLVDKGLATKNKNNYSFKEQSLPTPKGNTSNVEGGSGGVGGDVRTDKDFANEKESYRVIVGDEAFNDIIESGVVRTNADSKSKKEGGIDLGNRPTAFPSFSRGKASIEYAAENPNNYIIVTEDGSIQPSKSGRHGKGTTMFPTDENGNHLKELSGEKIKVYKHIGDGKYELVYENGKAVEQSQSKQESGGKAPVTKPEGKSDVVGNQQKVETKRVEKVAELEAERDMAILREKVPEMGNVNEVVPTREAVSAGSSADNLTVNKRKRAELKNRYTELQKLLGCLMK